MVIIIILLQATTEGFTWIVVVFQCWLLANCMETNETQFDPQHKSQKEFLNTTGGLNGINIDRRNHFINGWTGGIIFQHSPCKHMEL